MTPADTDISWWASPGWVDARSTTGTTPLWLSKRPDSVFWWYQKLPGTRVAYANIAQVRNGASESFEDFSNRLLSFVDTAGIDKLIIDLRVNRGGNGSLLKPLERGLLKNRKFNQRGNLFILTGRSTWSAAQFFLNDMLEFSEAMFVGEPSGSKGNSYGDSRQIVLPNSGITARASIYYWQDWHPLDERPWIAPDIAAELTFADYKANRDPALAAALRQKVVPSLANQLKPLFAAGDTAKARDVFRAFLADPQHVYIDGHPILDEVAVYFLNRSDFIRATSVFSLAASQYPNATRAHLNLAAMYQQLKQPDLERKSLMRVLELEPSNSSALSRMRALGPG
jgi:tetratricopeptide (TPR) repeat protein